MIADVEREINAPLASRFDLITGTSIGGILALALALEIPAQDSAVYPVLIGTVDRTTKSSNYWFLNIADVSHAIVADSREEVEALAVALGTKPPTETKCPCWLFATETLPAVPQTMPATVKELFAWLQAWDRQLYQQIQLVLERETKYLRYSIATPANRLGAAHLGPKLA